jgi:hypothetical protein
MWLLADLEVAKVIFLLALIMTSGWCLLQTCLPARGVFRFMGPARTSDHQSESALMERWRAELRDTVETLSEQMDCKIAALKRLIDDSERRIARLEAIGGRSWPAAEGATLPRAAPDAISDRTDPVTAQRNGHQPIRHAEIYALADAGLTSAAIAGKTGNHLGEVELILGLRPSRG